MESHPPLFPFRGHYKAPAGLQPLGTHSTATKDGTDSSAKPSPYLPEGRQKGFGTSVEAVEAVERKKKEKKRAAHPTHVLHWRDLLSSHGLSLSHTHLPFSAPGEAKTHPW
ncbi:hypothetical protein PDIG_39340 [Penicillium digitatum PHI26]|uniref:Uncharacterized protein n=2 Tax=Penicillium digitatum TaxID=36651 RepID=K9FVI9_PEND2|nr:hypothetical protein PDIP_24890 [Penicillium digitatum Pd1]EKV13159.1 hypothetical protein PDIG_39340 [Penicillium digitatum PHI26]EKV19142.1 hypothetical protein PDIP_24890 [Penicillium digitatum Pd1]